MIRRVIWIAVLVALGLGAEAYRGLGEEWIRGSAGGICYVALWILAWLCVRPSTRVGPLAAVVVAVTCGLEFAQLVQPPWLEALRGTRLGGLLLGSTFAWWDFPAYLVGGLVGGALGRSTAGGGPARTSCTDPPTGTGT